jgi:nucleotide-binding universal stress UspA family protein
MTRSIHKIVWSVDPFQAPDDIIWSQSVEALRVLARTTKAQIHPVGVYTLPSAIIDYGHLSIPTPVELPKNLSFAAARRLKETLLGLRLPNLMKPKLITTPTHTSTTGAAMALSNYAHKKLNADLILLGTHGRSGVPRYFIGSFAESIILKSQVPLFVVGASSQVSASSFDHILFPTDFDDCAMLIFQEVLKLAKQLKARVTIVHIIEQYQDELALIANARVRPMLHSALTSKIISERRNIYLNLGRKLMNQAENQGVDVDCVIRVSNKPIGEAIRLVARQLSVSFIGMAAHSGAIRAALTGSTARQVVRSAPCPVWLLHKTALSKAKRQAAA